MNQHNYDYIGNEGSILKNNIKCLGDGFEKR